MAISKTNYFLIFGKGGKCFSFNIVGGGSPKLSKSK
jgi:hypothetical protein